MSMSQPRLSPSGLPHSSDVRCLHRTFAGRRGGSDCGRSYRRNSGDDAHPKSGREPATFRFWLLPPCFPGFRELRMGKQKMAPKDPSKQLICWKKIGAGEGIRTLDPDLGKIVGGKTGHAARACNCQHQALEGSD